MKKRRKKRQNKTRFKKIKNIFFLTDTNLNSNHDCLLKDKAGEEDGHLVAPGPILLGRLRSRQTGPKRLRRNLTKLRRHGGQLTLTHLRLVSVVNEEESDATRREFLDDSRPKPLLPLVRRQTDIPRGPVFVILLVGGNFSETISQFLWCVAS